MEFDAEVYQLSAEFMRDYPAEQYPELMCKAGRPYNCLLVDLHLDYFICIPYRSSIRHPNAFMFHGTRRSQHKKSGLDYSKIVLVREQRYFSTAKAVVDQDEYRETQKNLQKIASEAVDYVNTYIDHVNGKRPLHEKMYDRRYRYSTLPYFHDIMGLA